MITYRAGQAVCVARDVGCVAAAQAICMSWPASQVHCICPCLRRYPNRYESIIGTLCDSLESLDEPEAKASMVWIIGEYSERIDNAGEWVFPALQRQDNCFLLIPAFLSGNRCALALQMSCWSSSWRHSLKRRQQYSWRS